MLLIRDAARLLLDDAELPKLVEELVRSEPEDLRDLAHGQCVRRRANERAELVSRAHRLDLERERLFLLDGGDKLLQRFEVVLRKLRNRRSLDDDLAPTEGAVKFHERDAKLRSLRRAKVNRNRVGLILGQPELVDFGDSDPKTCGNFIAGAPNPQWTEGLNLGPVRLDDSSDLARLLEPCALRDLDVTNEGDVVLTNDGPAVDPLGLLANSDRVHILRAHAATRPSGAIGSDHAREGIEKIASMRAALSLPGVRWPLSQRRSTDTSQPSASAACDRDQPRAAIPTARS
jgi:hypothetical protein